MGCVQREKCLSAGSVHAGEVPGLARLLFIWPLSSHREPRSHKGRNCAGILSRFRICDTKKISL